MKGELLMKNTTHRVVILKNVNSTLIAQAILILKDGAEENETGVMLEAERIVEKYMERKPSIPLSAKKKLSKWVMPLIAAAAITLCAVLWRLI